MEAKKLRLKLIHTSSATDEACLAEYVRTALVSRSSTDRLPGVHRSCKALPLQLNKPAAIVQDLSEAANYLLKSSKLSTASRSSARDISHRMDRRSQSQAAFNSNDIVKLTNLPSSTLNLPKNIEELRTNTRTHIRHKPTGRRDAELVAEWLETMLEQVKKEKDLTQMFTEAEMVFKSCYDELVAQVSVQCSERGDLLRKVWDAYVGLLERSLKQIKKEKLHEAKILKTELSEQSNRHFAEVASLRQLLEEAKRDREDLEAEIRVRSRAQQLHMQRERKLTSRLEIIQKYYEDNKRKFLTLKEKYRVAKIELDNRLSDYSEDENGRIIKTKRVKRFKQRQKAEIKRDVMLDPGNKDMLNDSIEHEIENYDAQLEIKYDDDDFKDKGTDTNDFVKVSVHVETELEYCAGDFGGEKAPYKKQRRVQTDVKDLCGTSEGIPKSKLSSLNFINRLELAPAPEEVEASPSSIPDINIIAESEALLKQIQSKFPIPETVKEMISTFARRASALPNTLSINQSVMEDSDEYDDPDSVNGSTVDSKRRQNKKNFTEIVAFRLNKRKHTVRVRAEPHVLLVQRVLSTPVHAIKNVTIKKMLLKMISSFYEEALVRLKDDSEYEIEMAQFVYEQCLNKYGFKKAAEQKFTQIVGSCLKFKECLRIETFGRFMGLYDSLDSAALSIYLKGLEMIRASKQGKDTQWIDYEESHMSPFKRAEECLRSLYEVSKSYNELQQSLLQLKAEDTTGANKFGVIEVEHFLRFLLEAYIGDKTRTRTYVKRVFEAADMNGDSFLQYDEYQLLVRYLSPLIEARSLFVQFADIHTDDGLEAITFENFLQLVKMNPDIFPDSQLFEFAGLNSNEEAEVKLEETRKRLDFVIKQLKWRWPDIDMETLDCLTSKILQPDDPFAVWLGLRLLEEESKKFKVENALKEFLPELTRCDLA